MSCTAVLKDPYFEGLVCMRPAKYLVCGTPEEGYIHPRCGTHSKSVERITYRKLKKGVQKPIVMNEKTLEANEEPNKEQKEEEEEEEWEDEKEEDMDPILAAKVEEAIQLIGSGEWKTQIPTEVVKLIEEMDYLNECLSELIKRHEVDLKLDGKETLTEFEERLNKLVSDSEESDSEKLLLGSNTGR